MKPELLRISDELVTAVLNGTLQGIVLAAVVAATLSWVARRTNATTRHGIWMVTLVLVAALFPANWLRNHFASREQVGAAAQSEQPFPSDFEADLSNALVADGSDEPEDGASGRIADGQSQMEDRKSQIANSEGQKAIWQRTNGNGAEDRRSGATGGEGEAGTGLGAGAIRVLSLALSETTSSIRSGIFPGNPPDSCPELRQELNNRRNSQPMPLLTELSFPLLSFYKYAAPDGALEGGHTEERIHLQSDGALGGAHTEETPRATLVSETRIASVNGGNAEASAARTILDSATMLESEAAARQRPAWERIRERLTLLGGAMMRPISWNLAEVSKLPGATSLIIVVAVAVMATFRLGLLVRRLFEIRKLKRESEEPSVEIADVLRRLRRRLGITRPVTVRLCRTQRTPVLLGFLHPVILLPAGADLQDARSVLRHELAHVSRGDDWANLFQQLAQACLFFHPAVWWVSRKLTLEREIACDDHVLEQSTNPRAYALLLTNLAGRTQGCPPLLAAGVSINKSQLKKRIDMILKKDRDSSSALGKARLGLVSSAAVTLALMGIYAAPRIVLAQSETAPVAAGAALPAEPGQPAVAALPTQPGQPGVVALPAQPGQPVIAAGASIAPVPAVGLALAGPDAPSSPTPDGVGEGPKYKAGDWAPDKPHGPITILPAPAVPRAPTAFPPTPALAPVPVAPEVAFSEGNFDHPTPGRHRADRNASVEERLDRLEKMLHELMAQRDMKFADGFAFKSGPQPKAEFFDRKQADELKAFAKQQADMARQQADMARKQLEIAKEHAVDPKEIEKLQSEIERQVAHATEQAKRAAEQAARAMKEQKDYAKKPQAGDMPSPGSEFRGGRKGRLEELHRERDALERQMQKLQREIERLERDKDKLDEQSEEEEQEQVLLEKQDAQDVDLVQIEIAAPEKK